MDPARGGAVITHRGHTRQSFRPAEGSINRLLKLGETPVGIPLDRDGLRIDSEGNAIGVRRGTGNGPKLVISAHLDTVFPEGTDVSIMEKDGRLYAENDSLLSTAEVRRYATRHEKAGGRMQLHIYPFPGRGGHFFYIWNPELYRADLESFLDTLGIKPKP